MNSVLGTIKEMLGLSSETTAFDTELLSHINYALMVLSQIGAIQQNPPTILSGDQNWEDFWDEAKVGSIKTDLYLRVKLAFDPPASSFLLDSYKRMLDELDWRLANQESSTT